MALITADYFTFVIEQALRDRYKVGAVYVSEDGSVTAEYHFVVEKPEEQETIVTCVYYNANKDDPLKMYGRYYDIYGLVEELTPRTVTTRTDKYTRTHLKVYPRDWEAYCETNPAKRIAEVEKIMPSMVERSKNLIPDPVIFLDGNGNNITDMSTFLPPTLRWESLSTESSDEDPKDVGRLVDLNTPGVKNKENIALGDPKDFGTGQIPDLPSRATFEDFSAEANSKNLPTTHRRMEDAKVMDSLIQKSLARSSLKKELDVQDISLPIFGQTKTPTPSIKSTNFLEKSTLPPDVKKYEATLSYLESSDDEDILSLRRTSERDRVARTNPSGLRSERLPTGGVGAAGGGRSERDGVARTSPSGLRPEPSIETTSVKNSPSYIKRFNPKMASDKPVRK